MFRLWIFLLICNCFIVNDAFSSLACSQNGTSIIYVNGIWVDNWEKTQSSIKKISNINQTSNESIDQLSNVGYDYVYNESVSHVADIEELLNQISRLHTGKSREAFFEEMLQDMIIPKYQQNFDEKSFAKGMILGKRALDFIHKKFPDGAFYKKDDFVSWEKNINQIKDEIYFVNSEEARLVEIAKADKVVTEQVKSKIVDTLKNNKKLIFVSHSQGNAVLLTAVDELRNEWLAKGNAYYLNRLDRYFGSVHVANPTGTMATPALMSSKVRSNYVTLDKDLVIAGAKWFLMDKKYPPLSPNYTMTEYNVNGIWAILNYFPLINSITNELRTDLYHGFDFAYLNPAIKAKSVDALNQDSISMDKIFTDHVISVAESLESNCDDFDLEPNVVSSEIVRSGTPTQTFTTELSGNITDGFSDGGLYPKYGNARFKVKLADTYVSSDVLRLERLDTNEILDPSNFIFHFDQGGDYIIPIRLSRLVDGNVVGNPVEKSVKIHISNRIQAKVVYAECYVHFREDLGYFSGNGEISSWGISQSSPAPIVVNGTSQNILSYIWGIIAFPQFKWYDAGIYTERFEHIKIEDYSGVIFDQDVANPCFPGMTFEDVRGLVPVN